MHAANLAARVPGARLVAIADIAFEAAQKLAGQYNVPHAYDNPEAILDDPAIDAVIVASATDTHPAIIEGAAAAGKHIFCEKPIARSLAEIDGALAAVDRAGVKLQIGFNRRFDANFARVRRAIVDGEIGQPHLLHIISRDPGPPPLSYIRASGGIFLDMTIHDFDMARFLLGSEVVEVYTSSAVLVDPAIGEAATSTPALRPAHLRQRRSASSTIAAAPSTATTNVSKSSVPGGAIQTENKYPNAAIISTGDHIRCDLPLHFFLERYADSFALELGAVRRSGRPRPAHTVTGEDGRIPVVMALAAAKSLHEKRPVRLDEIAFRGSQAAEALSAPSAAPLICSSPAA